LAKLLVQGIGKRNEGDREFGIGGEEWPTAREKEEEEEEDGATSLV
jgi:hypothetical protein